MNFIKKIWDLIRRKMKLIFTGNQEIHVFIFPSSSENFKFYTLNCFVLWK